MRDQTYPTVDASDTAPGADLTARSYERVAAQPAHISTRITRIATVRGWLVDSMRTDGGGRVQRQATGYVELRPVGEWDDERIACATTPVSGQHTAMTAHVDVRCVVAGGAIPDSCMPYGEIGDGDFARADSLPRNVPRPIDGQGAAAALLASDDLAYSAMRYGWMVRRYGCMQLATADLMDCTEIGRTVSLNRIPREWNLTTAGDAPSGTVPRCAAVSAQWYPRPAVGSSTGLALVRIGLCAYGAEP